MNAEQWKEILRDRYAAQTLRLSLPSEFVVAHAIEGEVGGQIREGLILVEQVQQIAYLRGLA